MHFKVYLYFLQKHKVSVSRAWGKFEEFWLCEILGFKNIKQKQTAKTIHLTKFVDLLQLELVLKNKGSNQNLWSIFSMTTLVTELIKFHKKCIYKTAQRVENFTLIHKSKIHKQKCAWKNIWAENLKTIRLKINVNTFCFMSCKMPTRIWLFGKS